MVDETMMQGLRTLTQMSEEISDKIDWGAVINHFGRIPSFHDSEVVSVQFSRSNPMITLKIHAWTLTGETDEAGYFIRDREGIVVFAMDDAACENIAGWNNQNVLRDIEITVREGKLRLYLYDIYGTPGFGIGGAFQAASAKVSVEPIAGAN